MSDKEEWDLLVKEPKKVLNPKTISPFTSAGQVSAAIAYNDNTW